MAWERTVRAQRRSKSRSGSAGGWESRAVRESGEASRLKMGVRPPRLREVERSHSLARKRFMATRRKVRKRPRSGSARRSQSRARRRAKNS